MLTNTFPFNFMETWEVLLAWILTLSFLQNSYLPFKIKSRHFFLQEASLDISLHPSILGMYLILCLNSISSWWLWPPVNFEVLDMRESVSFTLYHETYGGHVNTERKEVREREKSEGKKKEEKKNMSILMFPLSWSIAFSPISLLFWL